MFDPTKPVQTRDGRKVRILCTDANLGGGFSVAALVTLPDGSELVCSYTAGGSYYSHSANSKWDLVNIPEKKTWWRNVYPDGRVGADWTSREYARAGQDGESAAGCLEIQYEDGKLVNVVFHKN